MYLYQQVQSSRMKRIFVASVLAVFIATALFLGLAYLVQEPDAIQKASSNTKSFDFIRQKSENELKPKSRVRPPKPKKKPPPPEPKMALASKAMKPQLKSTSINLPKINLPTNFKGDLLAGVNVGNGNMEVIPLVRMRPMYPKKALRMKKEGYVTMRFTINPDGTVRKVQVIKSAPKKLFDQAAVRALKKWKFKPKLVNGKAVAQEGEQTINFTLRKR